LLAQQDRIPDIGESFQFGEFRFEIVQTSDRRIELVRISRAFDEREQE
jgi:CBS domain containing-hemolysin-like protein